MAIEKSEFVKYASLGHPLDLLPEDTFEQLAAEVERLDVSAGSTIYEIGSPVKGLYLIVSGSIKIISPSGEVLSQLASGAAFGERGLLRDGIAPNQSVAEEDSAFYLLPKAAFERLIEQFPGFRDYFTPPTSFLAPTDDDKTLFSTSLEELMSKEPISVSPDMSAREAAQLLEEKRFSCVPVTGDEGLIGILTTTDLASRIVAAGRSGDLPVGEVMTPNPFTLAPDALGYDALLAMFERGIGHLPIVASGKLVGILTLTDLVRRQALADVFLITEIKRGNSLDGLAASVAKVPQMLVQLNGAGVESQKIGRVITSVTDALTLRLIDMAVAEFGEAPVPWLWLACGSQGRREQTGVSDQDNCLILSDDYDAELHGDYFKKFAQFVSDGLDRCGYFYCPGDMMATNDRWRQPLSRWREYFQGWIAQPDPMAQMLASVMFDLRPIAGDETLFEGLVEDTLSSARANSIFRAHMISNSIKHSPALGMFGGFSLGRKGEHKDRLDLKHGGVVPIVDLARVYALQAGIKSVNTLNRLQESIRRDTVSKSGGRDLIDAYCLINDVRLDHQARQIRAGVKPDNFMSPSSLSELERNHLRDAFVVVKTMQSALAQLKGGLS